MISQPSLWSLHILDTPATGSSSQWDFLQVLYNKGVGRLRGGASLGTEKVPGTLVRIHQETLNTLKEMMVKHSGQQGFGNLARPLGMRKDHTSGDQRWRGGKSSFVSPTLHPHLPTGCPQGTCTWGHHPRAPRAAQAVIPESTA